MIFWLLIGACQGALIPSTTKVEARDLPSLPSLPALDTPTYTNKPSVVSANDNPYVSTSTLPENLVFIVIGSILLLLLLVLVLVWGISTIISRYKAKRESEKYYYNNNTFSLHNPFNDRSSMSLSSSSILETKSNFSNMSQPTLSQPLGKSYRNAQLDNNRGSMFFSPTSDFFLSNDAVNNSEISMPHNESSLSLLDPSSAADTPQMNEYKQDYKPKRPPSQYLEDLLDD